MKPSFFPLFIIATVVLAFLLFFLRHANLRVVALVAFFYIAVFVIFTAQRLRHPLPPKHVPTKDLARRLEQQNQLVSTVYQADRAFRVDEHHGEGPHYFLELATGGVLHLSGPYLYDYEPGDNSLRHFPCTQFTVRKHRELGYTVDLVCGGLVIEPEVEAPPYTSRDFQARHVPDDGVVLQNVSFDQLIFERTEPKSRLS